jgi:thiamine-phosphate pyrophosphorylase
MMFPSSGLYAITQTDGKSADRIIQEVSSALKGGACVIQYRDKHSIDKIYLAKQLQKICKQHQVPLIINDDAELARQIGADGVHLGKDDGCIATARKVLGSKAIIGVSCYDDINIALQAEKDGVDYVAFGRFFPSNSKPLALPAHTETLSVAKVAIKVPIVAIGGILPENGASLLGAGADLLAVIGGIFDYNPEQSAQAYTSLFNRK